MSWPNCGRLLFVALPSRPFHARFNTKLIFHVPLTDLMLVRCHNHPGIFEYIALNDDEDLAFVENRRQYRQQQVEIVVHFVNVCVAACSQQE